MTDTCARLEWQFECQHPDYRSIMLDFSEFALGPRESQLSGGHHKWGGGFQARPGLILDLYPTIKAQYAGRAPIQVSMFKGGLRAFFRFLDSYERTVSNGKERLALTNNLHQITGVLLELFSQPGPNDAWRPAMPSHAKVIRAIVSLAIESSSLPRLRVSVLPNRPALAKETVSDAEGLSLVRHLRSEASRIFKRWQKSDALAAEGRNLLAIRKLLSRGEFLNTSFTQADLHSTFRELGKLVGNPAPTLFNLYTHLGLSTTKEKSQWWTLCFIRSSRIDLPRSQRWDFIALEAWRACAFGLLPSSEDVVTLALLCLGRTAWNPSTLTSLEVDKWYSAYDDSYAWLFAPKGRSGGALQYSVSSLHHATSAYQVIRRLLERNSSLRTWIRSNSRSYDRHEIALRSPWLGIQKNPKLMPFVIDPRDCSPLNRWLSHHVGLHNSDSKKSIKVRPVSSSDFRDLAAAIIYRESRYSTWTLMVLLGHTSMATTRRYGFRHASRQESHILISQVVEDALDQIATSASWTAVLTRAKLEGVVVDDDAIRRLEAYRSRRTYSGALCRDPTNPPSDIDPLHPKDGRSLCVQGHLCVAKCCPQATVLNDSLDDICKTVAELQWRKLHTGAVRFDSGSASADLEMLRRTLAQWPADEVTLRIAHWTERLDQGAHRAIHFGGQH